MGSHGRLWFLSMIVLTMFVNGLVLSEAKYEKKPQLPSAVVVGTVYCDACFQEAFSNTSHFISGALVAVECGEASFRRQVQTNEKGEFRVHLPFSVSKHAKKIKACSAKLIRSSEPDCAVASPAAWSSPSLHLKGRDVQGTHVFSAGLLAFKPRERPELCSQKPKDEFSAQKFLKPTPDGISFPPPLQDPPSDQGLLPPLPLLPPLLPPLPVQLPPLSPPPAIPVFPPESSGQPNTARKSELLPDGTVEQQELFSPPLPQVSLVPSPPAFGFPLPPNPFQPPSVLPPAIPNPLQPPPSIIPPIPILQPPPSIIPPIPILQPPPSIFPPNPFQPSPPSFNLPPIPGLFPSPPPPRAFPFPFPPIFPGNPPAAPSSSKKTISSP